MSSMAAVHFSLLNNLYDPAFPAQLSGLGLAVFSSLAPDVWTLLVVKLDPVAEYATSESVY
jgi:hypothetical protein